MSVLKDSLRAQVPQSLGLQDFGTQAGGSFTPDCSQGCWFKLVNSTTAATINNPINLPQVQGATPVGLEIFVDVKNTNAATATITFGGQFLAPTTTIATGKRSIWCFLWDGTNWVQNGTPAAA